MNDPSAVPLPGALRSCERCGKPTTVVLLGESAPVVCALCAAYENRKVGERALEGSPSETAFRQEIHLDEDWR